MKVKGHWVKQNFARPGMVSLYNTYIGGFDVSDQRVSSYARLMRGAVWYYKIFFYIIQVCVSNAHILERKSPCHTTRTALDFRKSLISDFIEGKSFRRDTQMWPPPNSEIRFNQEHFHHLVINDKRSTCKVHLQCVDTFYSSAVCGICMCLEPCFLRYHTSRDFYFNDEDREGPRRLKEGGGRPHTSGRGRVLQN